MDIVLIILYALGTKILEVVMTSLIFNRDSDKMVFERLRKEFDAARVSQTEGSLVVIFHTYFWLMILPLVALCER